MEKLVRFWYAPSEDDDYEGTEIFVQMSMPLVAEHYEQRKSEIEDAISSYLDSDMDQGFAELALNVARSFDPDAKIVKPLTFYI